MISRRPYMLRAMYDWMIDSDQVPHIVVDTKSGDCIIPEDYVKEDGQIVLNIGTTATSNFEMNKERVSFVARFKGEPYDIVVPVGSIICIYDRSTGKGMVFGDAEATKEPEFKETKHPHLKVVK